LRAAAERKLAGGGIKAAAGRDGGHEAAPVHAPAAAGADGRLILSLPTDAALL